MVMLIETSKAEVNSKDSEGRTPLSYATENVHEAVVKHISDIVGRLKP